MSAGFIASLEWATSTRENSDIFLWMLPVAGLAIGLAYHYFGAGLDRGSNLIIDQIHEHTEGVSWRLTPLIFVASTLSHLAGASVGREGAALQLSAGVADPLGARLGLGRPERSLLLVAAVASGFGSVFGVPVAGAIFALEVQKVGRIRHEALVPAFVASFVGDAMVRVVGVEHTTYRSFPDVEWSLPTAWRTAVFGILAGLVAMMFVRTSRTVKSLAVRVTTWPPLRPMLGGVALVVVVLLFDLRDYQGLSIQLALDAHAGSAAGQWVTKLAMTALSIGTGFVGGEVIPLVVIGALAGASFGSITGGDIALFAVIGSVAVLAGAANTPIACTILGVELFGGGGIAFFAVACAAAYAASGHTGIYHAQRVSAHKSGSY